MYAPEDRAAIAPLIKTKWDQGEPFYNQCPVSNGRQCYTGCVATAMAQVMYYHKYPEAGIGSISFTSTRINQTLSLDFTKEKFDWSNMLDYYAPGNYTEAQANAVAYLMKACGYSVKMGYGTESSGASGVSIGAAMVQYFNYDVNCHSEYRMRYSFTEWNDMMYNNLKEVGPVIINGQAPGEGGHSFVCDGYDNAGYYHINWGWGGMSDGYFALEALNPGAQGIGGFAGGFNFFQNAIFGIQPPAGKPMDYESNDIILFGAPEGVVEGDDVVITARHFSPAAFGNASADAVTVNLGLIMEPVGDTGGETQERIGRLNGSTKVSIPQGGYFINSRLAVSMKQLADGRYKATVASRDRSGAQAGEWVPVWKPYGYPNYLYITVADGVVTVENIPVDRYTLSSAELTSALYYGKNVKMKMTLVNDTGLELSQGICPQLYRNGKLQMTGESEMVTVPANSTVEREWITSFDRVQGVTAPTSETEYDFVVYDAQTGETYGDFGKVVMKPAPRVSTVLVDKAEIENMPTETVRIGDREVHNVYQIPEDTEFKVNMDYSVTMGYMDGKLIALIGRQLPDNPNRYEPVVDEIFSVQPFLNSGENGSSSFEVNFPEAEKGVLYGIAVNYVSGGSVTQKAWIPFMVGGSGVEAISGDIENEEPVYYNLQGMRVCNPEAGDVLIRVVNGRAVKVIVR